MKYVRTELYRIPTGTLGTLQLEDGKTIQCRFRGFRATDYFRFQIPGDTFIIHRSNIRAFFTEAG